MAGAELPSRAIREQIGSAVNIIVQQSRLRDGSRKVVSVTEVLGCEGGEVQLQEIFPFRQTGLDEDGKVIGALHADRRHAALPRAPGQRGRGAPAGDVRAGPRRRGLIRVVTSAPR